MTVMSNDIEGMIELARERVANHDAPVYLVPTYYGLAFDTSPPSGSQCLRVEPNGEVWLHPSPLYRIRDGAKPEKILDATR